MRRWRGAETQPNTPNTPALATNRGRLFCGAFAQELFPGRGDELKLKRMWLMGVLRCVPFFQRKQTGIHSLGRVDFGSQDDGRLRFWFRSNHVGPRNETAVGPLAPSLPPGWQGHATHLGADESRRPFFGQLESCRKCRRFGAACARLETTPRQSKDHGKTKTSRNSVLLNETGCVFQEGGLDVVYFPSSRGI